MIKTRKNIRLLFAVVTTVIMAVTVCCSCGAGDVEAPEGEYQSIDTVPMLIMHIQKCSKLYTAEYKIHKIITHDDVVKLQGSLLKQNIDIKLPLGNRKVAIPMDATLKAYIDFCQFTEDNVERDGQRITIFLPDPKVELTSSKINQEEIRSYVGLVRAGFSDEEMTRYEQQGREAIIQSIPRLGIIDMARENAARTLVPMLEQMGYQEQNITIAFRKQYRPYDIRKYLEIAGD